MVAFACLCLFTVVGGVCRSAKLVKSNPFLLALSLARKPAIASKITGATNVSPRNIEKDLDGSLKRLQTDYLDVYLLHWPQRYSPQSNWGQSLRYDKRGEYRRACTFEVRLCF